MICAQIWAMRISPGDYEFIDTKIRINLNRTLECPNMENEEEWLSPISYYEERYNSWTRWYWESSRLQQWVNAGKPAINKSNITIGKWND